MQLVARVTGGVVAIVGAVHMERNSPSGDFKKRGTTLIFELFLDRLSSRTDVETAAGGSEQGERGVMKSN